MLLQIILERGEAHDQRSALPERPQTHVDAKHETLLGPRIEQSNQFAPEAVEVLLVVDYARDRPSRRFREQQDQIDVGGEIELPAAELAHAEHDQPAFGAGAAAGSPKSARSCVRAACNRRADAGIGEIRNRPQASLRPAHEHAMSRHAMRSISRRRHSRNIRRASASAAADGDAPLVLGVGRARVGLGQLDQASAPGS